MGKNIMDDAEICVVSYGITAGISRNTVDEARKQGIKVGMIRPITVGFPVGTLKKSCR